MYETYASKLWWTLVGRYPEPPDHQIPFIISIFYYSVAVISGRILRRLVTTGAPHKYQPYLLDMVITFQVLCCSLENGQIRKHYGMGAYACILFAMSFWHLLTIHNGSANPCAHVIRYLNNTISIKQFIFRVLAQTAGGLSSYQFAKFFWSFELTKSHSERYREVFCTSDLTVPFTSGFLVEFGGTFLDALLCLTTFSPFYMMEAATKIMMGCSLTIIGVDWTGYYLNPINATNQNLGCNGTSLLEHFIIYWLAPLSATALGFKTHSYLRFYYKEFKVSSTRRLLQYSPSLTFEEIEEIEEAEMKDTEADNNLSRGAPWEIIDEVFEDNDTSQRRNTVKTKKKESISDNNNRDEVNNFGTRKRNLIK